MNWLIDVAGVEKPIPAEVLIEYCTKGKESYLYALRKEVSLEEQDDSDLLKCHLCKTPVVVSRRKNKIYIKHKPSADGSQPIIDDLAQTACPFYMGKSDPIFEDKPRVESKTTKALKLCISESIKQSSNIKKNSVKIDQVITDKTDDSRWRSPHVCFQTKQGDKWAVEILRSWINPSLIEEREMFYRDNNIRLLWLVYTQSLGVNSITFGDLMHGNSKEKNVFAVSYESIKASLVKKNFFLHVFYPGNSSQEPIVAKTCTFDSLRVNQDGSPYYKDCSSVTIESLRDYLVSKGLIEKYDTDEKVFRMMSIEHASKVIGAAKRTSTVFLFDRKLILNSLTEIAKLSDEQKSMFKSDIRKLERSFNLNLKILECIQDQSGHRKVQKHLGQISKYSNSRSVFTRLERSNIVSVKDLIAEDVYQKSTIIDILRKPQQTFEDYLVLTNIINTFTGLSKTKLLVLFDLYFSTSIQFAIQANKEESTMDGQSEFIDYYRLFHFIITQNKHGYVFDKNGVAIIASKHYSSVVELFKGKKYQKDYYNKLTSHISQLLEKHRP
ncbi:MAG: hypothetical protein AB3N14_18645 [Flavobacteriaceae bacterium]